MKVAIAHPDRATVERLRGLLLTLPGFAIAWQAGTAREALADCRSQRPDLLLMGLDLPGLSVGELTRRIMAESACPILLLNPDCEPCHARIFEALGQGAADAALLPEPADWPRSESWADLLKRLDILRTLGGHPRRLREPVTLREEPTEVTAQARLPPVVAIGASTGGPRALATVLARLPANLPATVVIVQHLDSHFIQGLAEWLDRSVPLPVAALTQETALTPGQVWIAARPEHLIITGAHGLGWTTEWPGLISRPSIDVFFKSLAQHPRLRGCGVLLTGMGRDGAEGLLAMRQAGYSTMAQEEASCVVYGMPKAAAELGAAAAVLRLEAIADRIIAEIRRLSESVAVP